MADRTELPVAGRRSITTSSFATGTSIDDTLKNIREAVVLHIEGLREDGLPVPEPSTRAEPLEIAV